MAAITITEKLKTRLIDGVKKYKPIVKKAQNKDDNESNTVKIVTAILSDVLGYDEFEEITSEFAIKKTFCDLAIKLDGVPRILIEVKSAGLDLKEQHMSQAVNYGVNAGVEWVILTNSVVWKVYSIGFGKPVSTELVYEFDFTNINTRRQEDIEPLYHLTKEAMTKGKKSSLDTFHAQQQVVNRFVISQLLISGAVLDTVRKSLKKVSPDAKITNEELEKIITEEIIKRDILDDDKYRDAKKRVNKALKPAVKTAKTDTDK